MKDHLLVIDGNSFAYRAFFSLPVITRPSDGQPLGAVYGFCKMLIRLLRGEKAGYFTHIACVFDHPSRTFRHDMYSEYKANRGNSGEHSTEPLIHQFPLIREAARAFNIPVLIVQGVEADDVIATCAQMANYLGMRTTVVSPDKDLAQIVNDDVKIMDPLNDDKIIDMNMVSERFHGLWPHHIVDVMALMGDAVDNVPGAPGVGIKTACALINEFNTLDELLDNTDRIAQKSKRQSIEKNRDQILMSRDLVKLKCDVELPVKMGNMERRLPDYQKLYDFFKRMEFPTLMEDLERGKIEAQM